MLTPDKHLKLIISRMGCIPSKQKFLDEIESSRSPEKRSKKAGPPSPVIEGEPAPWVTGHQVFSLSELNETKDNDVVVMNEKPS